MTNTPTKPSVIFLPSSGVTELERDVAYAVTLTDDYFDAFRRPVKATWMHGMTLVIEDPLAMIEAPLAPDDGFYSDPRRVVVLGRWEDSMEKDPLGDGAQQTWQGYAAQQLGEVLRQRNLAERLTAFGIPRDPEEYLHSKNTSNAVRRSLTLTYDELNELLTAAGFPPASPAFR